MEISKFIEWSNADIKSLQFEAKKAPKAKEVELMGNNLQRVLSVFIDILNQQRGLLNEIEESLKEKKRKFKYEIMLSDEIKHLDQLENRVDNHQPLSLDTMKRAGIDVP